MAQFAFIKAVSSFPITGASALSQLVTFSQLFLLFLISLSTMSPSSNAPKAHSLTSSRNAGLTWSLCPLAKLKLVPASASSGAEVQGSRGYGILIIR